MSDNPPLELQTALEQIRDITVFVGPGPGIIESATSGFEYIYGVSTEGAERSFADLRIRIPDTEKDRISEIHQHFVDNPQPTELVSILRQKSTESGNWSCSIA